MILRIINNDFHYECENLCRVFYPNEKITVVHDDGGNDLREVSVEYKNTETGCLLKVRCSIDGSEKELSGCVEADSLHIRDKAELEAARMIYSLLSAETGYIPPWGVLTGVRPSKLMLRLISDMGEDRACGYFRNELLVSEEKTNLALTVAHNEDKIIKSSVPESFSLYVSIPFCPSRCSYCSFVSHSITNSNAKKMFPEYLVFLNRELEYTAAVADSLGLRLESIYFGGGTPGVLDAAQLDELQCTIENSFDLSKLREYTVEIGRPDTVTPEKLRVLRLHNTDRISINPQTYNQQTLERIGRNHTAEQAVSAYRLARTYGFKCINTDLIAGLPGECFDDFKDTLDTAVMLAPENITVHTLALKRSSAMGSEGADVADGNEAKKMLDYSASCLTGSGYVPYYMYRQSKCVGNLENVGWCRGETQGIYNVFMMEECHTVLACGAGGVTKLCDPCGTKVERIFNYKYPYEYNSGFDEMLDRKEKISEFYNDLRK